MALSVAQLTELVSRSSLVTWAVERLRELGFDTTGWQEGRIQNTILDAVATVSSAHALTASDTVRATTNDLATGAALDLYSFNRFSNTREPGAKAAGGMLFTNAGTVAHVVSVGQLIIEETTNGQQYVNTSAGTIPAGGSLELEVEAVLVGADGNVPNNSPLTLITPLAGVTVTNPGPGDVDLDGFPDPWYDTRTGADPETDVALKTRNATQWGLLATEKTSTAYTNLAVAQQGIDKALIDDGNPRGAGTVDVYVASGSDLVSNGDKTLAQAAFAEYTMFTESTWPPTNSPYQSRVEIKDPPTLELDVQGVVYYDPQYTSAQVQTFLTTALDDFVDLIPIGGFEYVPNDGKVFLGDLLEVIENVQGVRTVTLSTPTGNVAVAYNELITAPADWITGKITFQAVTS